MTAARLAYGPVVAVTLLALSGCQPARQPTPGAAKVFVQYQPHQAYQTQYIIDAPDEITIKAPGLKEIDNTKAIVRSDGRISLNLLGEVQIAGLTTEQACDRLKKLADKYYHDPDIKIDVLARSKFYLVFGPGAASPSKKPYTGNDSVVRAIAEAGFKYEVAWPQQVYLSRPGKDGAEPQTAIIDFTRIFERGDLRQNYALEEGDIINIPDSPLAHFDRKASQVFGPITGVNSAVSSSDTIVHPAP